MLTGLLNTTWLLSNLPHYWKTRWAFSNPEAAQEKVLKQILHKNCHTEYGHKYGFRDIQDSTAFKNKLPVQQYEDFSPWIRKIRSGGESILTSESVNRLMPSSGSSSARKLIPYTKSLQQEFDRAIGSWIVDLFYRYPKLIGGQAYWSITPCLDEGEQEGSVPVGYEQDTRYLGGFKKFLVDSVMAVPSCLADINDIDSFRYVTLLELLKCKNLRLISIWHPSFLILLMNTLALHWKSLLRDLNDGTISPPLPLPPALLKQLKARPRKRRRNELDNIADLDPRKIWPKLELISCWGSGHASGAINELRQCFPGIEIQQKGLIATEAFMSLPFGKDKANQDLHPLAINSHFFEFIDDNGNVEFASDIKEGKEYQVIVSTGGGLYRYAMNDRIRVNGFVGRTPSLDFIGKTDTVSDFYGEKLNDQFVARQLETLLLDLHKNITFSMLAPDGVARPENYTLYLEADIHLCEDLSDRLEGKLQANPHYDLCRQLGQLSKVRIFQVASSANQEYLLACKSEGKRLGDIKPIALSTRWDWSRVFTGTYLSE